LKEHGLQSIDALIMTEDSDSKKATRPCCVHQGGCFHWSLIRREIPSQSKAPQADKTKKKAGQIKDTMVNGRIQLFSLYFIAVVALANGQGQSSFSSSFFSPFLQRTIFFFLQRFGLGSATPLPPTCLVRGITF